MHKFKVAVTLMPTVLADVDTNMKKVEEYIKKASEANAELIVFPEFFTTGFAITDKLYDAIADSLQIDGRLMELSKEYQIAIGGSYLSYDARKEDTYNRFGLFFPTGESYFHCKDIPTAIESFCYTNGDQTRVFDTPLGKIGIVMCWEQLRRNTYRQIAGKADFVIGGSCWWGFAPEDGEALYHALEKQNSQLAKRIPYMVTKKLGVPFVHASHHAAFEGGSLTDPAKQCQRNIYGDALILDEAGAPLVDAKGTPGVYITDLLLEKRGKYRRIPKKKYWIVSMPELLIKGFHTLNTQYEAYYKAVGKNEIMKRING